jgi:IclR family pca regulon transcriptional regulator
VLLSGQSDDQVDAYLDRAKLKARTKLTLTRKSALQEIIRHARARGYATTDQELELGLRSIALPVRNSRGTLVAAISASASSARVTLQQMIRSFLPVLREKAIDLGRAL